jgi:hypothetical protein
MPKVMNAEPGAEWALGMLRFHRGEVAYVKAIDMDTDKTFDLFIPRDMEYPVALGGLMMDGLNEGMVGGEYFADAKTYREVHPEPLLDAQEAIDELGIGRQQGGFFKRLVNRFL